MASPSEIFKAIGYAVKAYVLLEDALSAEKNSKVSLTLLHLQEARFLRWEKRIMSNGKIVQGLDPVLVENGVEAMKTLLLDADEHKNRYSLQTTPDKVTAEKLVKDAPNHPFGADVSSRRLELLNRGKIFVKQSWKKLRWAAFDKKSFHTLLADIDLVNNNLENVIRFLVDDEIHEIHLRVDTLLSILLSSKDLVELAAGLNVTEKYKRESTSALFKSVAISKKEDDTAAISTNQKLQLKQFQLEFQFDRKKNGGDARQMLGYYDRTRMVFLERKPYDLGSKTGADGKVLLQRTINLTSLLNNKNIPKRLHVLRCCGYTDDEEMSSYWLVFDLPKAVSGENLPYRSTLIDLMTTRRPRKARLVPSSTYRVQLALKLAESLLELHTAGWLHKGFRSSNIVFFSASGHHDPSKLEPYLVGFEDSRPIAAEKKAPEVKPSYEVARENLCRHPEVQVVPGSNLKETFTEKHDIYALGIVLVEIALWREIDDILVAFKYLPESQNRLFDAAKDIKRLLTTVRGGENVDVMDMVSHMMGQKYKDVVLRCLRGLQKEDTQQFLTLIIQPLQTIVL